MNRFGSTDYNPTGGSSSGSNDNDYKQRDRVLIDSYVVFEHTLCDVGVYSGQYGTSLTLGMDDVEILEGVITERDSDGRTKVMDWGKWYDRDENMNLVPFEDQNQVTIDGVGRKITEQAGKNRYRYLVQDGVLEGRDEPYELGDRDLWLSNSKKARTMAKLFSAAGHDVINENAKQDDDDWLVPQQSNEFNFRDELECRRLLTWFENVTLEPSPDNDLDEPVSFYDAVVLDAETETGITIVNDADEGTNTANDGMESESETSAPAATDGGMASATGGGRGGSPPSADDFPPEIGALVSVFGRSDNADRSSIRARVESEAPNNYDIDMDEIMRAIESEQ